MPINMRIEPENLVLITYWQRVYRRLLISPLGLFTPRSNQGELKLANLGRDVRHLYPRVRRANHNMRRTGARDLYCRGCARFRGGRESYHAEQYS
jgi:hypothetical protein